MKKTAFKMPKTEIIDTEFLEQKIQIKNVLSIEEQMALTRDYIESYFAINDGKSFGRYNFIEADLLLKVGLIDNLTSIDTDAKGFDINAMEASGVMEVIEMHVLNLGYFMDRLEETVVIIEEEKESEKALGSVIDSALSKLSEFASKLNVEDIDKIKEGVADILQQVEKSPVSDYLKGK